MEEFYLKTIVNDTSTERQKYTAYLFSISGKSFIPLSLGKPTLDSILISQQSLKQPRPAVHNTCSRTISSLGAKLACLYVYMFLEDVFYSYLRVFSNGKTIDIDVKFTDGICIALNCKAPIMFDEAVANKCKILI